MPFKIHLGLWIFQTTLVQNCTRVTTYQDLDIPISSAITLLALHYYRLTNYLHVELTSSLLQNLAKTCNIYLFILHITVIGTGLNLTTDQKMAEEKKMTSIRSYTDRNRVINLQNGLYSLHIITVEITYCWAQR